MDEGFAPANCAVVEYDAGPPMRTQIAQID